MARASAGIDTAFFTDLNKFLNAANKVDGSFNRELRKASQDVANDLATDVAAHASGPYSRVWGSLKAVSDRYPVVRLDGSKVYRRSRARSRSTGKRRANSTRMSDVFFGAEFGSDKYKQFPGWAGHRGYVFWPTVRANRGKIADDYLTAIERVWNALPGGK